MVATNDKEDYEKTLVRVLRMRLLMKLRITVKLIQDQTVYSSVVWQDDTLPRMLEKDISERIRRLDRNKTLLSLPGIMSTTER